MFFKNMKCKSTTVEALLANYVDLVEKKHLNKIILEIILFLTLFFRLILNFFLLFIFKENREMSKTSGRLNNGIPQIPVKRGESEFDSFRQSLPVFEKQEEIVKIIKENKVVLIVGETGSGKTTQVCFFVVNRRKNFIPCDNFISNLYYMYFNKNKLLVTFMVISEINYYWE